MEILTLILASLGAYLIGAIPFGIVASRVFGGQDPRQAGSGNIGFTNVLRVSGKKVGLVTLIGDFGKGWLVGWLAQENFGLGGWTLVIAFCVVAGHTFSPFLGFSGGKGVATGLGCVVGLDVVMGLILLVIWIVTAGVTRYSSGGAIVSFGAFPIISWLLMGRIEWICFAVIMSSLILYRHKENIVRIWKGSENQFGGNYG